ncbi:MAG: PKD domain-containing protein [Candidatus Latescibacterota bacterium]
MRAPTSALLAVLLAGHVSGRELGQGPAVSPPIESRTYRCFQFPDNRVPVIDGDLTDWEIVGDEYATDTFQLIEYNRRIGRGYDLGNMDVRVRTAYNLTSHRIYVAVEYQDDFHDLDRAAPYRTDNPGNDDIFELVVDADNSGGDFIGDLTPRYMSTHAQNYRIYFHERDGVHVWVWGPQRWMGEIPYACWASRYGDVHGTAGVSTLEFWVTPFNHADPDGPQASAVARLAEGDTLGMGYAVLDRDDDEGQVVKFWALADTVLMYRDAGFLPDFVLAPLEVRLATLPVVDFLSRASTAAEPRTVSFVNTTEGPAHQAVWHFGDGQTSQERNPSHTYRQAGRYTVTLEARGPWGGVRKRKVDCVVLPR